MLKKLLPLAFLSVCGAAPAAPVVDQLSPLVHVGSQVIYYLNQTAPVTYAQSFRPSQSTVSGAGVALPNVSGIPEIIISLYDRLPTNGGTALASGTASWPAQGEYFFDAFWDPVAVTPLHTYYLLITSTASFWGSADGYSDGGYEGTSLDGFTQPAGTDFVFRTFADDGIVTEVSEPGSLALFGLGLLGILARRGVRYRLRF
jgi:hypothetical protein